MEEAGFIRSLQADEPGESRGVGPFQTEGRIRREVAAFFPGMVVVLTHQREGAEHALDHENLAPLGLFARLGDVGVINALGSLLQEHAHQFVGRFEDGCAQKDFQLRNGGPGRLFAAEGGDQVLDFGFLGEADVWVGRFFLAPARRSSRERALRA